MLAQSAYLVKVNCEGKVSTGIINYSFAICETGNIDIKACILLGEIVDDYINACQSGSIDMARLSEGTYILEAFDSKDKTY